MSFSFTSLKCFLFSSGLLFLSEALRRSAGFLRSTRHTDASEKKKSPVGERVRKESGLGARSVGQEGKLAKTNPVGNDPQLGFNLIHLDGRMTESYDRFNRACGRRSVRYRLFVCLLVGLEEFQ